MAHDQPSLKISCKSVRKFMRKVANRHTDRQTKNNDDCLSSLAEVISWKLYHVRNNWNVFTDKQELIRWLLYRPHVRVWCMLRQLVLFVPFVQCVKTAK